MPGPSNTLLIEGSFEELADELAHYVDEIRKRQNGDGVSVQAEIAPLLEQGQKDEALKKLVTGSSVLNTAPEKGNVKLCVVRVLHPALIAKSRNHSSLQSPCSPRAPIP